MIQAILLIALGFLAATFMGILLAPSLWSRAYRLSRKQLEHSLPLSLSEIEATHDQLRASFAVRLRRLETALAGARQKGAIQLVENSRLQMQIIALKDQISDLELNLSERRNAAAVLEHTVTNRFPELDAEIDAMRAQLQERSYDLEDLTNKLSRREEALTAAEKAASTYEEELDRLREALEKAGADRTGRRLRRASQWSLEEYRSEYDRLNLELSKLRQQIAQLQDREIQQAGIIKGELQKLAELILTSAERRGEATKAGDSELPVKRAPAMEIRKNRPQPWLQSKAELANSEQPHPSLTAISQKTGADIAHIANANPVLEQQRGSELFAAPLGSEPDGEASAQAVPGAGDEPVQSQTVLEQASTRTGGNGPEMDRENAVAQNSEKSAHGSEGVGGLTNGHGPEYSRGDVDHDSAEEAGAITPNGGFHPSNEAEDQTKAKEEDLGTAAGLTKDEGFAIEKGRGSTVSSRTLLDRLRGIGDDGVKADNDA